jgi:translation initiation factor IF-2
MAIIRAYKLAEELKLSNEELLKKAAELGIQLRTHMVGLDDDQVELLRQRLGGPVGTKTVEKRIAGGVIRRRRASEPEPLAESALAAGSSAQAFPDTGLEPALEDAPGEGFAPADSEFGSVEPSEPSVPVLDAQGAPEVPAPLPETPAVVLPPAVAGSTSEQQQPPQRPSARAPEPGRPRSLSADPDSDGPPGPAGPRGDSQLSPPPELNRAGAKRAPRRTVSQEMNLKEQDTMARTMLGNVQRRLEQRRLIVERQSRMQPSRRGRGRPGSGGRGAAAQQVPAKRPAVARLSGETSFQELSQLTGIKVRELWRAVRTLGVEVDRDERVDIEAAQLLGAELGFAVEQVRSGAEALEDRLAAGAEVGEDEEGLEPRPPIVTVMGHVDHGKTSLLDTIRKANVAAGEAGGITQHIGAYQVRSGESWITFLDTPGHAAFTQMRARGAQVTDVVVLVVAAEDGVMPQTVEAIDHARAAEVPLIVAINKIDRPDANPARVKQALLEHKVVAEDFGGDTICVEVSATKGTGVDKLLEMLALQTEILELRARRDIPARGRVIEAHLERGRGAVATILVQQGTLSRGDAFVIGSVYGRVRTMTDDLGKALKEAGPSTPVQIVGLSAVPDAGEEFAVMASEREAKQLAEHRIAELRRSQGDVELAATAAAASGDIFGSLSGSESKELCVVLKTDVRGTMEAVRDGITKLSTDRVSVRVIHSSVGAISESDVMLASASRAVVIGFHVRPEPAARKAAEREHVAIHTYDIVYELLDQAKILMQGLLPPKLVEKVSGYAEVRELFTMPRGGVIAGCFVPDGVIRRSNQIRVIRNGVPIYSGRVDSLRRFKDDVREVVANLECGIHVENFNDVKVGDRLESYEIEERPDTL